MKIGACAAIIISLILSSSAHAKRSDCFQGMRGALIEGKFTGPLVCSDRNRFVFSGRTKTRRFAIYVYRYSFLPARGAVMHGGERLIIFRNGRYIGQYALSPPPYAAVSVLGNTVTIKGEDFSILGQFDLSLSPPKEILVDGDASYFYK